MRQSTYRYRSLHRILNDVSTLWTHQQCAVKKSSSRFNSPATIYPAGFRHDLLCYDSLGRLLLCDNVHDQGDGLTLMTAPFMTENVLFVSAQLEV